jgi:SAM-dependent methyltransferase
MPDSKTVSAGSAGSSPLVSTVSAEAARAWIERWDNQQQSYLPDREDRFTVIIDAVWAAAGRPDPLILDLGCGPGSLSVRLLDQLPAATVIGIDADPLTLGLGRAAYHDLTGLRFVDADLRSPGWSAGLQLDRQPDAAVSTTALHWLTEPALYALYAELATQLRPGGVVLNGDHLREDDTAPVLARLGRALIEREEQRRFPAGRAESWTDWWAAAAADPALAGLVAERAAREVESAHHGSPAGRLSVHLSALRSAGFAEIGSLWQRGENRVICGVLPD